MFLVIFRESSTWIPAEDPIIKGKISLELNSKVLNSSNILSYSFTARGPDHLNVYLSPKFNVRLMNTSFDRIIPSNAPLWNGRPIYFINYVWGHSESPLTFSIDLEVPADWGNSSALDIAISGKHLHDKKNEYTMQFKSFLKDFPNWANVVPAIANFESWEV